MQNLNNIVNTLNDYLFSEWVIYALVFTGVLFTIWSFFGQYRALTHGTAVLRGKYDEKDDPGAINHFQALSAALSATVGLGNVAGVAVAVALGGPGAVLWMWVIGIVGMALKLTEVTQSMLYRTTDDPENPHGGPMFVVKLGLERGGRGLGIATGVMFAAVIIGLTSLSGDTTAISIGIVAGAVLVALGFVARAMLGAIIGGIFVVTLIISAITGGNMFQAWNVADVTYTYFRVPHIVTGIILTLFVGAVIIGGIKRIGSVAGRLVPFMCVMYMLGAMYVLVMHISDIPAMLKLIVLSGLPAFLGGETAVPSGAFLGGTFGYAAMWGIKRALFSSEAGQGSAPIAHSAAKTNEPVREGVVGGLEPFIDTIIVCTMTALVILVSGAYNRPPEAVFESPSQIAIVEAGQTNDGTPLWTLQTPHLPEKTAEAKRIGRVDEGSSGWREGETVFMIVHADRNESTGRDLRRITGRVALDEQDQWIIQWDKLESQMRPALIGANESDSDIDLGIYADHSGASLTAYAFDRVTPGMGMWLVTIVCWLFAVSTMISWSYYGEQGVHYLCMRLNAGTTESIVFVYKLVYCALILLTTIASMSFYGNKPLIGNDEELDMWTTLGLGVMLVANIPIMLLFGRQAMNAYHDYFRRLESGEMRPPHEAPPLVDVIEGKDVK